MCISSIPELVTENINTQENIVYICAFESKMDIMLVSINHRTQKVRGRLWVPSNFCATQWVTD